MSKFVYDSSKYPSPIPKRVKNIIIDILGVDEEDVTLEANFVWDLGCDSLDIVELIMEFEAEYGISIPDEEAEKCHTVGDCVKLLKTLTDEI